MNIHKLIKESKQIFVKKRKLMEKHFKKSSILRLAPAIFCIALIIFSMAYVVYSQSGTTIGVNIATNDLLVAGNATTTGNQVISGNLNVHGAFSPDSFTFNPGSIFTVNGTSTFSTTSFLGDVNFNLKQIKNVVLEKLSNFPSSPVEGQMFWSTVTSTPYWYDTANTRWRTQGSGATIVVAASSSKNKEKADYICDGTADQVEINAAINSLSTYGGKVVLLDGTFYVSAPITMLGGIHLEGQGINWNTRGTRIFLAGGANCDLISVNGGGTNEFFPQISNMYLDGNKYNQTSTSIYLIHLIADVSDVVIEDVASGNCKSDGIKADAGWYIYLRRVYVEGADGFGFNTAAASNTLIDGCISSGNAKGIRMGMGTLTNSWIKDSQYHGLYIYGTLPTYVTVTNNHFVNNGSASAGTYDAINIDPYTSSALYKMYIIISNNQIYNSGVTQYTRYGVNMVNTHIAAGYPGDYVSIYGNNIYNMATNGVNIASGSNLNGKVYKNIGYATENSGTATITSGNTSTTVSHGLNMKPATSTIAVVPTNNMGSATKFWVSNVATTTFQINTDVDPGATTAIFNWQIGSY